MHLFTDLTDSTSLYVSATSRNCLEPDPMKGCAGNLESLIYFSTAVGLPTVPQLEQLLSRARKRNASEGVTGVLIYAEGSFVQYLEGPRPGIDLVYRHILADPLHHDIVEVFREPIGSREFAEWHMAFAPTLASGLATHFPVNDHLGQRLRSTQETLSGGRDLLDAFWGNALGLRPDQWNSI